MAEGRMFPPDRARKLDIKPGDFVLVKGDGSLIDRGITLAESRSALGDPDYDHCFLITDSDGSIIDTLVKVRRGNIFRDYAGREILIGRFLGVSPVRCRRALAKISNELGELYPAWRIGLISLGLGRWVKSHHNVCSERIAEFLWDATKLPPFANHAGWQPSDLADVVEHWREFMTVFKGEIPR